MNKEKLKELKEWKKEMKVVHKALRERTDTIATSCNEGLNDIIQVLSKSHLTDKDKYYGIKTLFKTYTKGVKGLTRLYESSLKNREDVLYKVRLRELKKEVEHDLTKCTCQKCCISRVLKVRKGEYA